VCNLCNGSVQFIIKHDKKARFHFASLQSEKGQALLRTHHLPTQEFDSVIYIRNGRYYKKSSAALYILRDLGGFWQIFFPLILVPPFLRNAIYSLIARNRYRWFGRQESCMLPTPELKSRFL
jgi:predicted DCC family thiol-disulfide oxidoreductase YuxK